MKRLKRLNFFPTAKKRRAQFTWTMRCKVELVTRTLSSSIQLKWGLHIEHWTLQYWVPLSRWKHGNKLHSTEIMRRDCSSAWNSHVHLHLMRYQRSFISYYQWNQRDLMYQIKLIIQIKIKMEILLSFIFHLIGLIW